MHNCLLDVNDYVDVFRVGGHVKGGGECGVEGGC